MKKLTLIVCCMLLSTVLFTSRVSAQDDAFAQGKIIVSAGYGYSIFGGAIFKIYDSYPGFSLKGMGPIHGKFEYALSDKIGMGISFNYSQYTAEWNSDWVGGTSIYTAGWKGTSMSIIARMNIHFATSEKLDPYWGFGFGYRSNTYTYFDNDPYWGTINTLSWKGVLPLGFETTIGMRYYFTPNIGIYAETGLAKSIIQGGLTFKF